MAEGTFHEIELEDPFEGMYPSPNACLDQIETLGRDTNPNATKSAIGVDDYERPPIDLYSGEMTGSGPTIAGAAAEPTVPLKPFLSWQTIDEADILPIPFVYGDLYAAGYVTMTVAPPKVGKSLLGFAEAIDAATGRGFLTGKRSEPRNVLYYCAEDDQTVIHARALATLRAHGIPQQEVANRLFAVSGMTEGRELILMRGERAEIQETVFQFLAHQFRSHGITLAIFDPLQDLSESPETNEAFRTLGKRLRRLAVETGVAIGVVHHTRKASPGVAMTMDDQRGGGSLRGVSRFNRLLAPMTQAEGALAGVDDHRLYFRLAESESNLAPPSADQNRWFQKVGVRIGNGHFYPTIRPWAYPDAFAGVTVSDACRVRSALADRANRDEPARENVQAADWAGYVVAEVLKLDPEKKSDKARIVGMLRQWIATGVLEVQRMPHGPKRKETPFVVAGPNNPGLVG